ncbi:hypothetical protein [Egicoccus sp. AB-alg2]|uniref:hypothetical protein n=1 Tax=Egicoccus sp. AB-alg2 TaxID=3242693 RepID=UPI00359E7945
MSAHARDPWWASDGADGRLGDADPVEAHRAARRGQETAGEETEDPAAPDEDGDAHQQAHGPDVCGVCPWCAGLRALAASHPEAVAHLTDAARHLTKAVRALVADLQPPAGPDAAGRGADAAGRGAGGRGDDPLERIDLD